MLCKVETLPLLKELHRIITRCRHFKWGIARIIRTLRGVGGRGVGGLNTHNKLQVPGRFSDCEPATACGDLAGFLPQLFS